MKVVIDTNILLTSIPNQSPNRWIYDAFISKKFIWVFSNEILSEYAEMIGLQYSERAMQIVVSTLLTANNTQRFEPFYKWQLIEQDADDNKFVDCSLGANVDYLVTDDRHFKILKTINFPKIAVVSASNFKSILKI